MVPHGLFRKRLAAIAALQPLQQPQIRRLKVKRTPRLLISLAAASALTVLLSVMPMFAADMDVNAKVLVNFDADWSKAAATRDADRVASFYAEDAVAYPPDEPAVIGRAAAKKTWAGYFVDKTFTISWKTNHAEVAKSGD